MCRHFCFVSWCHELASFSVSKFLVFKGSPEWIFFVILPLIRWHYYHHTATLKKTQEHEIRNTGCSNNWRRFTLRKHSINTLRKELRLATYLLTTFTKWLLTPLPEGTTDGMCLQCFYNLSSADLNTMPFLSLSRKATAAWLTSPIGLLLYCSYLHIFPFNTLHQAPCQWSCTNNIFCHTLQAFIVQHPLFQSSTILQASFLGQQQVLLFPPLVQVVGHGICK